MDAFLCHHEPIRNAVISCVSFWQQNHRNQQISNGVEVSSVQTDTHSCGENNNSLDDIRQGAQTCQYLHVQCSVLQVEANNTENSLTTSYTTCNASLYNLPRDVAFEIVTMRHFDTLKYEEEEEDEFISQTRAASIQIKTKKLHSKYYVSGFMVLLLDRSSHWRCISAAFSLLSAQPSPTYLVQPVDMKDVMACVWDGYCMANRACAGNKMAEVFHKTCRLTYVDVTTINTADDGDDGIRIWDCDRFCQKVTNRYIAEPPHIPYAHLQNDPLLASGDELLGIEFAEGSSYVAMVILKVGHPPFLWTDLLTCAKLGTKWYIVHNSSTSEPFLTHLCGA